MARGDHLRVKRPGYWHHGVDCGDGTVIHYSGELGRKRNAAVRRDSLDVFIDGSDRVEVVRHKRSDPEAAVMRRAHSRLGEQRYSLVFRNCEHFATWCKTGKARSAQVEKVERVVLETVVDVATGGRFDSGALAKLAVRLLTSLA